MSTGRCTVFGTGIMLAMLVAPFAGFAQESADMDDDLMPAVDTSAADIDPVGDEGRDAEIEALEPGVDTPVLAQDITRSSAGSQVMDSIELGRTEITGNQELPKVLYIVPWQQSDPGDLMGKPVNTLVDEVLAPIDREEFIRQVDYYGDLYGDEEQE
ncbi:MAG: hypothetical protein ACR2RD_12310 [Woeseiaceae bacterium]